MSIFRSVALLLALLSISSAMARTAKHHSLHEAMVTIEAGQSAKIFGAIDDKKKLLMTSISQHFPPFFHEIHFGGWMGGKSAGAVFYTGGAGFHGVSFQAGAGHMSAKNDSLGTFWQFLLCLKFNSGPLAFGLKHFSNGTKVFEHNRKPNHGLNFLTLSVTV